jgi:23S rRNA (cytidine2498-2'-O)-methyltransferase
LKQLVDQLLATRGFAPTVKSPQWIISLTLADGEVYYGLAPASENLSDWTGGMVHFRKSPEDVSRSMFKLLEAIERWHLELAPGSAALDLGAAPGGWTAVLLDHGLKVTAVDTGELDSRLSDHPRLTFYRQNVKDLHLPPGNQFQWITCDMSWNPFFTVRAVNALIPHLQAGGETILTVKLMGRRPRQTIRQVIDSLDPRLSVMHALHLFHNRREITLHLRRSG